MTRFPKHENKEKVVVVVMSNCTQACMCSGWCFWTYFTAIANAIGASFVVGSFDHLPSFSGGETPNFLHCLSSSTTLLLFLRWICATPPSLSKGTLFTKFFRGPLFERAKRTAVPCSIFRKVLLSKRMALADTSLLLSSRVFANTTKQQCSGHNTHLWISKDPWCHG